MMKRLVFLMSLLVLISCKKDDDETTTPVTYDVMLKENATVGKILTDSKGMTLYYFSKDTKDNSVCLDGCKDAWPIFYKENLNLGNGLNKEDFATITRTDGSMQTTYKGWPLYYFASDNAADEIKGEGVKDVWFVAKPNYTVMYAKAQLVGDDGENYKGDYTLGAEETFYLTNARGKTLYAFDKDENGKNNFTKSDFSNNAIWPIVEVSAVDKVPSILQESDFGIIDVFGRKQLTYKGWPLYYFGKDAARGDNKGVSVPKPGVWPIVNVATTVAP